MVFIKKGVDSSKPNAEKMTGLAKTTVIPVSEKTIRMRMTLTALFTPHLVLRRLMVDWFCSWLFMSFLSIRAQFGHLSLYGQKESFAYGLQLLFPLWQLQNRGNRIMTRRFSKQLLPTIDPVRTHDYVITSDRENHLCGLSTFKQTIGSVCMSMDF
jgi:hypothetical protein